MLRNKNKGFSLIELIVVIAIIGILVMLAAPRFLGYTEKARVARIRNDIKVVEGKVAEEYINADYKFDGKIDSQELEDMIGEKTIYAVEGKVDKGNVESGPYKIVEISQIKEARTKLSGQFYNNAQGKVYYVDDNILKENNSDGSTPDDEDGTTPDDEDGTTPDDEDGTTPNDEDGTTPDDEDGTTPDDEDGTTPDDESTEVEIVNSLTNLNWQKVGYSHFGYTGFGGSNTINFHDNGDTQIAVYYAKTPYMSYYNKVTKKWTLTDVPWWNHGQPDILYAGDGLFMAKIVGMANIITSYDGITWHNSGYSPGAQNHIACGAYDMNTGNGVVSFWYHETPIYHSSDPLEERTEWTLYGEDGESVPIFNYMTTHKGKFVGIVGGDKSIATANPSSPGYWTTTIKENSDGTEYMYLKSVNGKLFVLKRRYDNGIYYVNLSVLNDTATELIDTNLSHVGDITDNRIGSPENIIWIEEYNKFMLFSEKKLYLSDDGINWEGIEQTGLTTRDLVTFGGLIYTPGDGFYLSTNDGYAYYAPYELIIK